MCNVAGSSTNPARKATIIITMPTPDGTHENVPENHTGFPTTIQFINIAKGDAIRAKAVAIKDTISEKTNVPNGNVMNKQYNKAVRILLSFNALKAFEKNPPSTLGLYTSGMSTPTRCLVK